MSIQDNAMKHTTHIKMKWWFWLLLILGIILIIGGIVYMLVV